jgi:hypothetical protein
MPPTAEPTIPSGIDGREGGRRAGFAAGITTAITGIAVSPMGRSGLRHALSMRTLAGTLPTTLGDPLAVRGHSLLSASVQVLLATDNGGFAGGIL